MFLEFTKVTTNYILTVPQVDLIFLALTVPQVFIFLAVFAFLVLTIPQVVFIVFIFMAVTKHKLHIYQLNNLNPNNNHSITYFYASFGT